MFWRNIHPINPQNLFFLSILAIYQENFILDYRRADSVGSLSSSLQQEAKESAANIAIIATLQIVEDFILLIFNIVCFTNMTRNPSATLLDFV